MGAGHEGISDIFVCLRNSTSKAILTDIHFWVPVTVLVIGICLLAALR